MTNVGVFMKFGLLFKGFYPASLFVSVLYEAVAVQRLLAGET